MNYERRKYDKENEAEWMLVTGYEIEIDVLECVKDYGLYFADLNVLQKLMKNNTLYRLKKKKKTFIHSTY